VVTIMPKSNILKSFQEYIPGTTRDDLLVQKSNPLQTLSETSMTLPELKILDAYLARINSHQPENRHVRFEKGELEELLGVTKFNQEDLQERIKNLFQVITIKDKNKEDGFTSIALFTKAECKKDHNGYWQVDLMCSEDAMEYFFNIENIGYLKYRLKNVIELTSRYSYMLYLYLEGNKLRKEFTISVSDLRKVLNAVAPKYDQYKFFNQSILKKAHDEITTRTTMKYDYKPVKKGRNVVAIAFIIKTDEEYIEQQQIQKIEELDENKDMANNDLIGKIHVACNQLFSREEIEEIVGTLKTSKLPERIIGNDQDTRIYNFFVQVFGKFRVKQQNSKIKNAYSYFKKMIESEIDQAVLKAEEAKKNEDANFKKNEQSYDINEFKKFSVTFSGNTRKFEEEKSALDEWKVKVEEAQSNEELSNLIVKITLDDSINSTDKEELINLIKAKIK